MKSIIHLFIFAAAMLFIQSCGTAPKENAEALSAEPITAVAPAPEPTKDEIIQKRKAAQEERLRIAAEKRASADAFYKDEAGEVIYNRTEVNPSFPGGEEAMNKYFREHLKYPAEASAKGWEGTIYVEFIIGKDGIVRNATVTNETDENVDQSLRAEAIRVVNSMPQWNPGKEQGKRVHVHFNLPVVFKVG